MSSNDAVSMVFKCMLKGAADFLVKPIRKNELRNLWQHVWRKQLVRLHTCIFLSQLFFSILLDYNFDPLPSQELTTKTSVTLFYRQMVRSMCSRYNKKRMSQNSTGKRLK